MGMLRAIIVDDEYLVGQMINKLVRWKDLNLEQTGVYTDSEEACQAILSEHPDIVISDIKMPEMDGLELIRKVQTAGVATRFILISGFQEFEYAHHAIKLGVEDYLLKPIKADEINNTLKRIISDLEKERSNETEENETHKKEEQLIKCLRNGDAAQGAAGINLIYGSSFQEQNFFALGIRLGCAVKEKKTGETERKELLEYLKKSIQQHLKPVTSCYALASMDEKELAIGASLLPDRKLEDLLAVAENLVLAMTKHVSAFGAYDVYTGLSDLTDFTSAADAFSQVRQCLDHRMLLGGGRVILYSQLPEASPEAEYIYKRYSGKIRELPLKPNEENAGELLEKMFDELLRNRRTTSEQLLSAARHIAEDVYASSDRNREQEQIEDELKNAIGDCNTPEELLSELKTNVYRILELNGKSKQSESNRPVREAILYIAEHYAEHLTLEDAASSIQINPTYLSTVFKKETGENFLNYLTRYRMDQAKKLLVSTNDTMISIAEQVGYRDVRHFSDTFTRIVGIKPSVYRKVYS